MAEILTLLTAIFVVSSALIMVTKKLSHSTLLAYILAGVVIGVFFEQQQILSLSQLGIAFLVFIFGLKTEPGRIRSVAKESVSTTIVQLTFIGATAYVFATSIGLDLLNTSYLVLAAALSSSLVGLQLAETEIRIDLLHGRLSESIHLVQDLIAIVAVLVLSSSSLALEPVAANLLYGVTLIAVALVLRSILFPVIVRQVEGSTELTMLTGIGFLAAFIGASTLLNVSPVVGSFAAGLAIARFPHNLEMLESMGSLKDFFSAIFFVSLGALLQIPGREGLVLAAFLFTITLVFKPAITVLGLLTSGYDRRTSYLTALTLDQVSEFSLIVAIQAFIAGTINPELFSAIILAATVTMVTSAYTGRHDEAIYRAISRYSRVETSEAKIDEWTDVDEDLEQHVILIGYDTQGKRIAEAIEDKGQEFVIVENDPEKILEARKSQDNYVFGDVMDNQTWRRAKADKAKLVVSTVPQRKVSMEILGREKPKDKILRSREIQGAAELLKLGATYVEVPDVVAAEQLIEHLQGITQDVNHREELRRQNLLELRRYLQTEKNEVEDTDES